MKLYFVRHGESEANLLREFSNRGYKHGLTERGFQQAAAVRPEFARDSVRKNLHQPLKTCLPNSRNP